MEILFDLVLILSAACIGGFLAHFARLPLVIGYILSGIVLGVFFQYTANSTTIVGIAHIGVALLMFTLGLEFNLTRLRGVGEVILLGSLLQIFLTIIFGVAVFPFLGFTLFNSLFLGSVLALSSTAVVVKILSDKGELETVPGEIAIGWLLVQDLVTLPLMVILPAIGLSVATGGGTFWSLLSFGKAFAFSIALIVGLIFLGKYILPRVFQFVAEVGRRELLLLSVVAFCFFLSLGASAIGVSYAIGAFLAGLFLSLTIANHAIFAEVRPLADIFSIVFFVSLGFLIKGDFVIGHLGMLLLLTGLVLIFKFIVSAFLVFVFGYHSKIAFTVGISLTSVGEFAFIIAVLAASQGIISQDTYLTILSVATISLIVSTPLLGNSQRLYAGVRQFLKYRFPRIGLYLHRLDMNVFTQSKDRQGHIVVVGHGRVGKYITNALVSLCLPYVVVDYNMRLVKALFANGREVMYGDPSDIDVLKASGVNGARALVIAIPDRISRDMIISHAKSLNKNIQILCRIHTADDSKSFRQEDKIGIVQPEFEAALEITRRLLSSFEMDTAVVSETLATLRREHGY